MFIHAMGGIWIRLAFLVLLLLSVAVGDLELLQELCVFLS